jgi:SAM-dependent methyltransferase
MSKEKVFYCQICGGARRHEIVYTVDSYPICRCKTCGVGRVDIEGFDPSHYYDSGYFTGKYKHSYIDYVGNKEVISREFKRTVDFIRSVGPAQGKLLEIGCAYGFFLQQAKSHYDVYGVEIVESAAAYCQSSGLTKIKNGALNKEDLEKIGSLDVAVMLDVIEHIDNVAETVGMIAANLRPGGSFIVTTGDWSSLLARITGPRWRLMAPPLHLWYFSPESLTRLGARFGLEVVSCSHPWKIVPLELILHQAGIMLGSKAKPSFPKLIKQLGLPANLFDAVRIVFKKV